jgi:hypothetical protein
MKPAKQFRILHASLLTLGLCFVSACATMGPPLPPSLELPKPPLDLKATRKGDKVTLTWTIPVRTTDRKIVRSVGPTHICRGLEPTLTQCQAVVGETTVRPSSPADKNSRQKTTASYTDVLPSEIESNDPAAMITYAIEVRNADGRSAGLSNQVRVPLLRTEPPPDLHATLTKDGVVLNWSRNVSRADAESPIHYLYRVHRRPDNSTQWSLIGDFPAGGENDSAITDSNIEWEKTYVYRIVTVSIIKQNGAEQQIEGDDSPVIAIFAHDIFPPSVPSGLQAVFSGPGQKPFIDLVWAPVTDVDLDGYNVYRYEAGSAPVKVNTTLVKAPAYRDEDIAPGKHYIYSVSAVDVRGNESARSEEAGESVP